MRIHEIEEGGPVKTFVQTPTGSEAVLDGDCEDITRIVPREEMDAILRDADAPHGCILPPPVKIPLVRIPTPLPGSRERLTERPGRQT